jgi:hypothetical protein
MPDILSFDPKSPDPKKPAPVEKACNMPMPHSVAVRPVSATALAIAMVTPATVETSEPFIAIERLVALVLQASRRLGRRPSRLRPLIAAELDRHCRRGDPTALMLRKWIDRETHFDRLAGLEGDA